MNLTNINIPNTAIEGGMFVISVCMILRKESFTKDFDFQQELAEAREDLETGAVQLSTQMEAFWLGRCGKKKVFFTQNLI